MKRFFIIALILLLNASFCVASQMDETIEEINNLFVEDAAAEEIVPIADENPAIAEPEKEVSQIVEVDYEQLPDTSYEQSAQLEGYLEYNEQSESNEEQNAVYFDGSDVTSKINFSSPRKMTSKSLLGAKKPTFTPMGSELTPASRFSSQEYMINPISTSYSQKFGNVTFGTVYDSSIDSASTNYTTSIFSKIENERFALRTAFTKGTKLNDYSFSDKIYVIPELKLTKRLSLLNVWQSDANQINKKNEVVLRYTPNLKNYADDVQFEIGVGQSFYNDDYVKSSLRFSTKFKL